MHSYTFSWLSFCKSQNFRKPQEDMAGLKHFEIRIEGNPANVYFAGDTVKGKISFGLVGDGKKARG